MFVQRIKNVFSVASVYTHNQNLTCLYIQRNYPRNESSKLCLPPTDVSEAPRPVVVNDTHSISGAETLSIKADPLIGFVPHSVSR